ncbi:unnamed protein product [Allacma fusca]|uniref:Nuclear condensin complex subunit 3 C-terminal domain-containing protein n=1 Tax=Allacma fusca TaxID=39272 RepID=A0A8J2JL72_9HEXA|nr:unnamed protein product [Allacma fusca]
MFKHILDVLQKAQHTSSFGKIVRELKDVYYRQTDPAEIKDYRKYFFSLLWQAMVVPFKEGACSSQERMIKCYTKFVLETGTEEDTCRPNNDFPPFYTFCIRAYKEYHSDSRSLVRLRLIQLVHEILKEKHEEVFFSRRKTTAILKDILLQRSKDVNPTVRSFAFKCLQFLVDGTEKEILERLKYHSQYDPSMIARKSAFLTLVSGSFPVRPSIVVKKVYDKSEVIRLEAFKALKNIPFGNIKSQQRLKLIQWGLMQPSVSIKNLFIDELVPAWIADEVYCNDVIKFFTHIDIARNAQTAHLLFRALLPDDSEETFEKLDLSFLNEDKLIPIESMVVEKMLYWRYICNLFKFKPYCTSKTIPDPAKMIECVERVIVEIHEENRKAKEEDRDEEFEHILCLEQILRVAELCNYEEASRRDMEILLRKILRDPILDEAVVIFTAVDVAHTIVEKSQFSNFMTEILQEIFEVESRTLFSENQIRLGGTILQNSPIVSGDPGLSIERVARVSENAEHFSAIPKKLEEPILPKIINSPVKNTASCECPILEEAKSQSIGSPEKFGGICTQYLVPPMSNVTTPKTGRGNSSAPFLVLPGDGNKHSLFTSTPIRREHEETRSKVQPRNKQQEILKLKNERGELVAQRHRLRNKIETALKSNDFLEAERYQTEINGIQNQEDLILQEIRCLELPDSDNNVPRTPEVVRNNIDELTPIRTSPPSERVTNAERSIHRHSRNNHSLFLNLSDDSIDFNENDFEANQIVPRLCDSLRGIVMLTRFLAWQDNISPYVKMMYDDNIFDCLEKEDHRIRMFTMYLICMVGLIDKTEAKKSLAVLIQGISQEEDDEVVAAAFKCMVDLLLKHDYHTFLVQDEDEEIARELPYPLNDSNATVPELQCELMKHLKSFHVLNDEQKPNRLSIKVLGMIKLLIRNRIDDEDTISWLLDLWLDERYVATPISFNIGHWLPLYISMSTAHALRITSAFLTCIKRIFTNEQPESEEDLKEKASKLANFVLPHVRSHQEPLEDSLMLSERVIIMFLLEINRNAISPHAKPLFTFTKLLDIQTKSGAAKILSTVQRLISSLTSVEVMKQVKLFSNLKTLTKQLEKRFGLIGKHNNSSDDESTCNESNSSDLKESKLDSPGPVGDTNRNECKSSSAIGDSCPESVSQNDNNLQSMIFQNGSELLGNKGRTHNYGLFASNNERTKRLTTQSDECQTSV